MDDREQKRCPKCGETKPLSAFHVNRGMRNHVAGWCRVCKTRYDRDRQLADPTYPERHRQAQKRYLEGTTTPRVAKKIWEPAPPPQHTPPSTRSRVSLLKNKYGLTQDAYDRMVADQGGMCAICGQPETRKNRSGKVWQLSVDHDATTGQIRGLLCSACNQAIGYLRHNTELLLSAVAYLERFSED